MGTVANDALSIVAITTSPSGVVSGSIMLKGETHAIEYREGTTYAVYKVPPHATRSSELHRRQPDASIGLLLSCSSPLTCGQHRSEGHVISHVISVLTRLPPPLLQVDDSKLPKDHPKPVIPPGAAQVYHKPQHLDTGSRTATKAPTAAPTAPRAASTHLNRAPTAAAGRKLMRRQLLAETPGQVGAECWPSPQDSAARPQSL